MPQSHKSPQKIQSSIQTFKEIIQEGYLYIDKTKQLYDLITTQKACFLSRPRRFGKSLICSTLEQIFLGNKELFKGLWIYDSDYEWKKFPVIRIDMSGVDPSNVDEFRYELTQYLFSITKKLNINTGELRTPSSLLNHMIEELSQQNKVIIIIDEYDSPILSKITKPSEADEIREILRSFYKILKTQDENIRFTFVTGVTKFSKTALFSGANHLKDLTMPPRYADMLGYTQEELEQYFDKHIIIAAKNMNKTKQAYLTQLKNWYNGYRFTTKDIHVYNPFSINSHFDNVVNDGVISFQNYWFESGTPTFLLKLIKESRYPVQEIDCYKTDANDLKSFDIDNIEIPVLLFQAGYSTIMSYEIETRDDGETNEIYTLGYPNREVHISLRKHLLRYISRIGGALLNSTARKLQEALETQNMEDFVIALQNAFVRIPYPLHPTSNITKQEWFYQSIFYIICETVGFPITVEEYTNVGRIDAVITTDKHIYIFEFKIDSDAQKALDQIKEKRYYEKYQQESREIVLVGIDFDTTIRNIKDWITSTI